MENGLPCFALFLQRFQDARPAGKVVYGNVVQKMPVKTFPAARGGARAYAMPVPQGSFDDAIQAAPGGLVYVYDRVSPWHPVGKGAGVIPVHDPLIAGSESLNRLDPGFRSGLFPVGPEVMLVEVDRWQSRPFRELSGEGGFSGAGAADDEDSSSQ